MIFFSYLGGGGGEGSSGSLTSNLGLPKFQGRKTSSQSRYTCMYNKGENNPQFFIYGPQRASIIRQYKSTYKIWNVQDFLSCVSDEVSADAA